MKNIYVVGGGIVGVSCALNLQEKGFKVTIVEKRGFGLETSFGNAGVITRGSIIPLNNPTLFRSLHRYASNRHPAVRYNLPFMIKNTIWIGKFLLNATKARAAVTTATLNTLIEPALDEHKRWLASAGITDKLRTNGWFKLYRGQKSFDGAAYERSLLDRHKVAYQLLKGSEIQALEPALKPIFAHAMWVTDAASVDNPGEVVQGYAKLFLERGGQLWQDEIQAITPTDAGFSLKGSREAKTADQVVIAAGPWSGDLLKDLEGAFPMCFERGYHEHFAMGASAPLTRPFYDVEGSYVISPTNLGLRLSSGSELKNVDSAPTPVQLKQVFARAREAIELGRPLDEQPWCGSRPTLADSIPVIGPSSRHKGLWFAFGHQHIGFSTGPATGRLLAELINGETPFIDQTPFSAARFR